MYFRIWLFLIILSVASPIYAGETIPGWLGEQLPDRSVLVKPGVYTLKNGKLLGVGQGTLNTSLRGSQGSRMALDSAEYDAKQRVARHLFPDDFSKYKTISVEMRHSQRVFEQTATNTNKIAYVAIVVDADDVSAKPLLDASVILDVKKVVVPQGMFSYLEDPLLQLGGGKIFSYKNGWLAVGIGLAPLFGKGSVAERDAMKRARLEAGKALTDTIFGSDFSVMEQEAESQIERDGIVQVWQWSNRRTRESIEGTLKQAAEVGYWFTDDDHIAIVVAVSNLPLDPSLVSNTLQSDGDLDIPDYPDWDVEPDWEYALFSHPRLLKGGAILYHDSGEWWAVGVGAAKLTGNPANDQMNAPRAAQLDAQRNIIKYLVGFSSKSNSESVEEIMIIMAGNGAESSSILESLQKITNERANGFIRNMRKGGSWKSLDKKLLYQVHAVNVDGIFGIR